MAAAAAAAHRQVIFALQQQRDRCHRTMPIGRIRSIEETDGLGRRRPSMDGNGCMGAMARWRRRRRWNWDRFRARSSLTLPLALRGKVARLATCTASGGSCDGRRTTRARRHLWRKRLCLCLCLCLRHPPSFHPLLLLVASAFSLLYLRYLRLSCVDDRWGCVGGRQPFQPTSARHKGMVTDSDR